MWTVLLVGPLAAIGAALALGTLAALVRYHRTGSFPGEDGEEQTVSRGHLLGLWARVAVGAVVAVAGVVTLAQRGLLLP